MLIHAHFLWRVIFTSKIGQTDLFFGVQSGFISNLLGLCMQDYKTLHAAFTVCVTMVDIETGSN